MAGIYRRKYANDEDFDEEQVWGVMENNQEIMINSSISKSNLRKPMKDSSFFTSNSSSSPRMIPKSSLENVSNGKKQSSVPLDIPDWSKIYGKTSSKKKKNDVNGHNDDNGHNGYFDYGNNGYNGNYGGDDDDDDGDGDDNDGIVPPHEYLARKLARNQISSFSVYEGIGRTLKGRDLSKVRNAILSKTGFLE